MDYRMAVRAYWPEISDRVNLVFLPFFFQHLYVVDMHEAFCSRSVGCFEVKSADDAPCAIVGQTFSPRFWVPLIALHHRSFHRSFEELGGFRAVIEVRFRRRSIPHPS